MKFLIIPPTSNFYDLRLLKNLKQSLEKFNHKCVLLNNNLIKSEDIEKEITRVEEVDILFLINQFPSESLRKKKNFRCIIWIQDVFLNTLTNYDQADLRDRDIIYFLADKKNLGFRKEINIRNSYLFTGVSEYFLSNFKLNQSKFDIGMLGYFSNLSYFDRKSVYIDKLNLKKRNDIYKNATITENYLFNLKYKILDFFNFNFVGKYFEKNKHNRNTAKVEAPKSNYLIRLLKFLKLNYLIVKILDSSIFLPFIRFLYKKNSNHMFFFKIKSIIKKNYEPLSGSLDILNLEKKIKKKLNIDQNKSKYFFRAYNYLTREFPRAIDRFILSELILNSKKKIVFSGPGLDHKNWKNVNQFKIKNYYDEQFLKNFYQNCKININNNNHGHGMHSRVLESMGCGGFVLMHKNSFENETSLNNFFDENVHYASYDIENFEKVIDYFLKNEEKRNKIVLKAHEEVKRTHRWDNRAQQILNDLNEKKIF